MKMNPTDQFAFNLQEFVDQVRLRRPDPMGGVLVCGREVVTLQ